MFPLALNLNLQQVVIAEANLFLQLELRRTFRSARLELVYPNNVDEKQANHEDGNYVMLYRGHLFQAGQ